MIVPVLLLRKDPILPQWTSQSVSPLSSVWTREGSGQKPVLPTLPPCVGGWSPCYATLVKVNLGFLSLEVNCRPKALKLTYLGSDPLFMCLVRIVCILFTFYGVFFPTSLNLPDVSPYHVCDSKPINVQSFVNNRVSGETVVSLPSHPWTISVQ